MEREFLLGFIKVHILHHASKEPVYGAWLTGELARHGYFLSPGTLYPVLHTLERRGFLESSREVVSGRVRRYYRATEEGSRALEVARDRIRELVDEVLLDEEAPRPAAGRGDAGRDR